MPRRRKLKAPDPFFALEAEHRRLDAKLRPLEQAAWETRKLPADCYQRRKIEAAIADLWPKIDRLEDAIFGHVASTPPSPAALLACLNMFRDWVEMRREAMVDAVIARTRELLNEWTPVAPRPPKRSR
jgi:hypothetical protein